MLHAAARPFDSPLWLAFQQREEFVGWPELAPAKAWWYDRFDGLQFFGRIGSNVDLRRGQVAVPQPQGDFPDVLRRLQHHHSASVSKHMGRHLFAVQRRTLSIRCFGVTPENVCDSPSAKGFTASVHKELRRSDRPRSEERRVGKERRS